LKTSRSNSRNSNSSCWRYRSINQIKKSMQYNY